MISDPVFGCRANIFVGFVLFLGTAVNYFQVGYVELIADSLVF